MKLNHIVFTLTGESSSGENGKTLQVKVKEEEIRRLCLSKAVCCYLFLLKSGI